MTQQKRGGTSPIPDLSISTLGGPKKLRKAQSNTPAIIKPKNYAANKRRSGKVPTNKKQAMKVHHQQQSTEIDGWENITENNPSHPVIALGQINPLKKDTSDMTPLKDDPAIHTHDFDKHGDT